MRVAAVEAIGGYRDDLIAAEDDELCVRLRAKGWRIWRLDSEMAVHDAAITRFDQWWRRALRSGYAFAQGAYLHGAPPERHFVWESRRAWIWGIWLPFACLAAGLLLPPWGWAAWLIYPLQGLRLSLRNRGSARRPRDTGSVPGPGAFSRSPRPAQISARSAAGPAGAPHRVQVTPPVRIAYLLNQYPKVSHSFIRREILALEREGFEIMRIALRGWNDDLRDAEDERERERTRYVLRDGPLSLLSGVPCACSHTAGVLRARACAGAGA